MTLWEQMANGTIKYAIDSTGSVSIIGTWAFAGCSDLLIASFPSATSIGFYAFKDCQNLIIANFPVCTSIGISAFHGCSKLKVINFPYAISVGIRAFVSTSVTNVFLPAATTIFSNAFRDCVELRCVSLGNIESIHSNAFNGCLNLFSLYLTGSSVCSFYSTALWETPIEGLHGKPYGSIYVPASLYSSYINAPGWSFFSQRFVSV